MRVRAAWLCLLCVVSSSSFAQSRAGGTLSWTKDSTFVSTTQARYIMRLELDLRWGSNAWVPLMPGTGTMLTSPAFTLTPSAGTAVNVPMTVQSVNMSEDWLYATGTAPLIIDIASLPVT